MHMNEIFYRQNFPFILTVPSFGQNKIHIISKGHTNVELNANFNNELCGYFAIASFFQYLKLYLI